MGSMFELCWSRQRHRREIARVRWIGFHGIESEDTKRRVHPTQKPAALAEFFFEKWGKKDDLVADLYLGSGSTLIACEKTGRRCFGMELDPKYCDVILARWEKFTGKTASLSAGKSEGT
jgi:DNA modification methylase